MNPRGFRAGTSIATATPAVNIRFTSSLTQDDENRLAAALVRALGSILDSMPIAYVLRIDTSDANVYQHAGPLVRDAAMSASISDASDA
jgi:hypothetical protein